MEGLHPNAQHNLETARLSVDKILDTFLGQDNKIYYKVRWQETWEPEEKVMALCAPLLNEFWKEYYAKTQLQQQVRNHHHQSSSNLQNTANKQVEARNIADIRSTTEAPVNIVSQSENISEDALTVPTKPTKMSMTAEHEVAVPAEHEVAVPAEHEVALPTRKAALPPSPTTVSTNQTSLESHIPKQAHVPKQVSFPILPHLSAVPSATNSIRVPLMAGITNLEFTNRKVTELFFQPKFIATDGIVPPKFSFTPSFVHFSPNVTAQNIINVQASVTGEPKKAEKKKVKLGITCPKCKDVFESHELLFKHSEEMHSIKSCPTCGKTFDKRAHLKRHMLTHTTDRPYVCAQCGKGFKEKSNLTKHTIIHSGLRPHACDVCNARFRQLGHLLKHVLVHKPDKPFQCDICKKGFKRKEHLKDHKIIHSGKFPFECEVCHKKFRYRTNLKVHILQHSGTKDFVCNVCSKAFSAKANLTQHMLIHKTDFEHKCELCDKMFKRKGHLRRHMEVHKTDKSLNCPFCKLDFVTKKEFRKHMLSHTGAKPFACSTCFKRFFSKMQLSRHQEHCNVKENDSFKCWHCQKVFESKDCYEKHLLHHNCRYQCSHCSLDFSSKGLLKKHMLVCLNPENEKANLPEEMQSNEDKRFDFCESSNCNEGFLAVENNEVTEEIVLGENEKLNLPVKVL